MRLWLHVNWLPGSRWRGRTAAPPSIPGGSWSEFVSEAVFQPTRSPRAPATAGARSRRLCTNQPPTGAPPLSCSSCTELWAAFDGVCADEHVESWGYDMLKSWCSSSVACLGVGLLGFFSSTCTRGGGGGDVCGCGEVRPGAGGEMRPWCCHYGVGRAARAPGQQRGFVGGQRGPCPGLIRGSVCSLDTTYGYGDVEDRQQRLKLLEHARAVVAYAIGNEGLVPAGRTLAWPSPARWRGLERAVVQVDLLDLRLVLRHNALDLEVTLCDRCRRLSMQFRSGTEPLAARRL